jgi:hypothetical protein
VLLLLDLITPPKAFGSRKFVKIPSTFWYCISIGVIADIVAGSQWNPAQEVRGKYQFRLAPKVAASRKGSRRLVSRVFQEPGGIFVVRVLSAFPEEWRQAEDCNKKLQMRRDSHPFNSQESLLLSASHQATQEEGCSEASLQ